ncbi:MAG: hypothetical protein IPP67_00145 [Rhodospirillaceae bacterium]|nr:hypothetical protein [Rhodospirillaceae bacterium]
MFLPSEADAMVGVLMKNDAENSQQGCITPTLKAWREWFQAARPRNSGTFSDPFAGWE